VHPFDRPGSESSHFHHPSQTISGADLSTVLPEPANGTDTSHRRQQAFPVPASRKQTAVRRQVIVIPPSTGRGTKNSTNGEFSPLAGSHTGREVRTDGVSPALCDGTSTGRAR
jgi:hypothetical protein